MSDIDANRRYRIPGPHRPRRRSPGAALALIVVILIASAVLAFPMTASAGHASAGKLAFEPCTRCHPVTVGADGKPTKPLPNGFKKHEIVLEVHDILGKDDKACLVCHDDPSRNPGKLFLADGSTIDVTGDVSRVCQRCHFEKYREWTEGIHGKREPKCTASGCHDAHTPSWIYVAALPPFQGTGFEVRAVGSGRKSFKPLPSPPLPAPVETAAWLVVVAILGSVVSVGLLGYLILGRPKR